MSIPVSDLPVSDISVTNVEKDGTEANIQALHDRLETGSEKKQFQAIQELAT